MFAAKTRNDLDGFDFKPDKKVRSLRFVLEIERRQMPMRVEVGKNNQKLPTLPFEVKIQ